MPHKQAVIFGASGICGWAFTRECLVYPKGNSFDRVIGLSYRSLSKENFTFAKDSGYNDSEVQSALDKLDVYGGINLEDSNVVEELKKIPGIEKTTHVFYAAYAGHVEAYTSANPFEKLNPVNLKMINGALSAVTEACPNLQFWLQLTGSKAYGWEFDLYQIPGFTEVGPSLPWKESDLPLASPFKEMIFYNNQYKRLEEVSAAKGWKFAELIPNMIIGFNHRLNPMGWAQPLGLFLSFYKEYSGSDTIAFPGAPNAYTAAIGDSSQDITARCAIHIALSDTASGKRYNISDEEKPVTLETLWPQICALVGLKGTGIDSEAKDQKNVAWLQSQKSEWPAFEKKHGLKPGIMEETPWTILEITLAMNFDRSFKLDAVRDLGFKESEENIKAYEVAFARMRAAKLMP